MREITAASHQIATTDAGPVYSVDMDKLVKVQVYSFGYLHPDPEIDPHITIDLRNALYDPHVDPAMRELTGLDPRVHAHVMATPGANEILMGVLMTVQAMLPGHDNVHGQGTVVRVAFGCAGGRHRSVVLANALLLLLQQMGIGSEVCHEHVQRPVVRRGGRAIEGR